MSPRLRRPAGPAPAPSVLVLALGLSLVLPLTAAGETDDPTAPVYRTPAQAIVDVVDAPPTPRASVGPGGEWLLLLERPSLPPIEELAVPELRLAGMRIDPAVGGRSRTYPLSGLRLVRISGGAERPISGLPAEPRIDDVSWSPDGAHVAFTHRTDERIELWVAEVATASARRLADAALNLAGGVEPRWMPDGRSLVAALVPADRGVEPPAPGVPAGPVIQENAGKTAPVRTYQDLLGSAHDAALFEHYLSARLARIGLDGSVRPLGGTALVWDVSPSPDGRFLLVETLHRPFSYLVPADRFPRRVEVLSAADGSPVRRLADLPLQEEVPVPFGSVPTGPRDHAWRSDAPAQVAWAEALDGGDAGAPAEERDRIFLLAAPFTGEPAPLATLALRYDGVDWGRGDLALVYSWWWKTRTRRAWRVRPDEPDRAAELLIDHNWEDRYHDPGEPVTVPNASGHDVLLTAGEGGGKLVLIGDGASPEGDRPFLDLFDLATKESERLFRSEAPYYELPVEPLDVAAGTVVTRREAIEEPPNYFVRDVDAAGEAALRRLTAFPHPTPQLLGVGKELIRYRRDDGVELTGTLYTPAGWTREDGPLPTLLWAYPQEFKDADLAGQVTDSPYRFVQAWWGSPLLWLTQGYAVLDDPAMPIVGEGEVEPNDTYVDQLVASAKAAVDEMVRRGVGEPGRFAVGGHSYGAFMAANLLAHSDLFAAGIARSGAYNRTLTPFGFQAEERTLWQAPEVYVTMSPFMHAHKIDEPILLIHGDADNNSGTFPIQSERFYHALKGHGAPARLVMLPFESHGYRARESVLHALWESGRWLDRWVRDAEPERPEVAPMDELAGGGD